jgi:DNA-binding MurR/RpiR family transcriptional regulator
MKVEVENNILEHIANTYYDLTKTERYVADFIMANPEKTQYLSITELSAACNTTESTVTRFCKSLGLTGFYALKLALAKSEKNGNTKTESIATEDDDLTEYKRLALNEMQQNFDAIKQTYDFFDEEAYMQAVKFIKEARHVYCMGQGGGIRMAAELKSIFLTISPKFTVVRDLHSQMLTTSLLKSEDLIICFSYSGATVEVMEIFEIAKKNDCPVILITRFSQSPAAKNASVILQCGSNEPVLKSGSMAARFAQLQVIDWLFEMYFQANNAENKEKRNKSINALSGRMF